MTYTEATAGKETWYVVFSTLSMKRDGYNLGKYLCSDDA